MQNIDHFGETLQQMVRGASFNVHNLDYMDDIMDAEIVYIGEQTFKRWI